MIMFEYFCDEKRHGGCGHEFEVLLNSDDRMKPLNEPCPKCGKKETICRKYNVNLHHHVIRIGKKMPNDYMETITRIKKEHPNGNFESDFI